MLQFYFLSILLNGICGLLFMYSANEDGTEAADVDFTEDSNEAQDDVGLEGNSGKDRHDEKKAEGGIVSAIASAGSDQTFKLVVGILSGLTGIMKFLSPIQFDVAVIGDFVPAVASVAASACILVNWYESTSSVALVLPSFVKRIFGDGKKYLGVFCIIAAVLHFIFPRVLFL